MSSRKLEATFAPDPPPALTPCGACHLGYETVIHDQRMTIDAAVARIAVDEGIGENAARTALGLRVVSVHPAGGNGAQRGRQSRESGTSEGDA